MLRKISRTEIVKKLSRLDNHFTFVEATQLASYEKLHLPAAVLLEPARAGELAPAYFPNKARELVVYGESSEDAAARKTAEDLYAAGYFNVFYYEGGKRDWRDAGLSTEAPIRPGAQPQPWKISER